MVFVFGIDVPFLELLFIYVILILFALVIVLIELGKLRKLLMIEKGLLAEEPKRAIAKPSSALPSLKTESKKMKDTLPELNELPQMPKETKGMFSSLFGKKKESDALPAISMDSSMSSSFPKSQVADLRKYIKNCYANGFAKEEVRDILVKTGWPRDIVDQEVKL